jgi:cold shock CspA family protein
MATGTVKFYFIGRSYGYIEPDDGGQDVHVKWSAIRGSGFRYLVAGERVRFATESTQRGLSALWVETDGSRQAGTVERWDQMRGIGWIRPDDGDDTSFFFHHSDVLSLGRSTAVEGEAVTFEVGEGERGPKAVKVKRHDPRPPLTRFARLPHDDEGNESWSEELAALAEPEDWNCYGEEVDDSKRPILVSYVTYTFARLEAEEREQQQGRKIATAELGGTRYACFNTGLVTPLQEEIFAFFTGNRTNPEVWPYFLEGFLVQSDRRLGAIFGGRLPELARYFDNAADLIYDPDLELSVDAAHVVEDNLDRFPAPFNSDAYLAQQVLEGQLARQERRARRNYKTGIPQFHHGSIQLLLPLHLSRPDHADLALVVERTGDCYRGSTVLPLQWAYRNARLLTRPDPDWLVPDED